MHTTVLTDCHPSREGQHAATLATAVVPAMTRARALIDWNPASATYGCADRPYWYYRTLVNFPGASWQQLMVAFASLYRTRHAANPFFGSPEAAQPAAALLGFWARAQHRDGAFDEWYLNEHSYCATAVTAAGAALTLHLIGDVLPPALRDAGIAALTRACRWLEPRYNVEVANQNLAAVVAVQGLAAALPGSRWQRVADERLGRVARDQAEEGWLPEYSGMDFGYSTLALDFLAALKMLGGNATAVTIARRLCRFLVAATGIGRGFPGALGSRGTSHFFPFGALYFATDDQNAARLAERSLAALASGQALCPAVVDDRYFAYFYQPHFALAFLEAASKPRLQVPEVEPAPADDLPGSGLLVLRRHGWSATVSRRLGGAVAIESATQDPRYHLGYEAITEGGGRYSSAVWEKARAVPRWMSGQPVALSAPFRRASSGVPISRLMIPFQLVVHGLRTSWSAERFQAIVKRRMIAPKAMLPLTLERRIDVLEEEVRICDRLLPNGKLRRLAELRIAQTISMHSPSARQADPLCPCPVDALDNACRLLRGGNPAILLWVWRPGYAPRLAVAEPGAAA